MSRAPDRTRGASRSPSCLPDAGAPPGAHGRRAFLKRLAAGGAALCAPLIVPARILGGEHGAPPSERVAVAVIGTGGRGIFHVINLLRQPQARILALCDVHAGRREETRKGVERERPGEPCSTHVDFRAVLDRRDIDAVVIASPDHWHALQTVAAARAGKDVYCEKPLTHTVAEGQAVVRAVRRAGIVFQHGTQQRSEECFRIAAELVQGGRIGKLRRIRLGVPAGQSIGPQPVTPVPPELDYDLWLGPAPWAPHTPKRVESSHSWYWISDYCVGYIAGWGVHHVDSAQQGNGTDLTGPVEVDGWGLFPRDGLYDTATQWRLEYRYASGVTLVDADVSRERMGVTYEGSEGSIYAWRGNRLEIRPEALARETARPAAAGIEGDPAHMRNFLDCVKSRLETAAPVEVGHRSTTICTIGAICMRLGRKLRWDPAAERFEGDEEANRMLSKAYRAPWRLE